MSRLRLILLSMFAVFAVGAVASASASAHGFIVPCHKVSVANAGKGEWNEENPITHICEKPAKIPPLPGEGEYTEKLLPGETHAVEGKSGLSILESKVGAEKIVIECEEDVVKVTLEAGGKTKGEIEFKKNCKVKEPAGCAVAEPIVAKFTDELVGAAPEDEFTGSGAGEEFASVHITGCALENFYKVKGKQLCKLDAAHATLQAEHELKCTKAGSNLKLGSEVASFSSAAKVKLVGGGSWAIE